MGEQQKEDHALYIGYDLASGEDQTNVVQWQGLKSVTLYDESEDIVDYIRVRDNLQISGNMTFDISTNRQWRAFRRRLRKAVQKAKRRILKDKKKIAKAKENHELIYIWNQWYDFRDNKE